MGFLFMELGIQDIMRDSIFFQHSGDIFRGCDISSSYKNRLSDIMCKLDMLFDEFPFDRFIIINFIIPIDSDDGSIGRYLQNGKFINFFEFLSFRKRSTGHSSEFSILPKEILIGNSRQSLGFPLNFDTFLCFYGLMQSFGESPSRHCTSGMLIYDEDFIIFDDIFLIFFIDCLCTDCILDMMNFFVS